MSRDLVQALGTSAALVGFMVMFFCGSPFKPRTRGEILRKIAQTDVQGQARERLMDLGSWAGFAVSVVGTATQIVGYSL